MHAVVARGEEPFPAALELNRRLFTPHEIPLGIEHARKTGPMPCGLSVDMERARFARRAVVEMQNSKGAWEPLTAAQQVPLGEAWARDGDRWRPALSLARTLDGLGYGQLCHLPVEGLRRYGRELVLGTRRAGGLELAPWLHEQLGIRNVSPHGIETEVLARLPTLAVHAGKSRPSRSGEKSQRLATARFDVAGVFARGEQLVAHFDFSPHLVSAHLDSHGCALLAPLTREVLPACCEPCPQLAWCRGTPITTTAAWAWRKLGLIAPEGTPTPRGVLFSFFHHGEGLAVAAALEDESYPIEDLVFDLANLRAGPRFAGDDAPHSGRLGALCQTVYERGDFPGYLEMGVPTEYGAGAADVVREIVQHRTPRGKLLTESLRAGDIERALIEWRSLLRHIVLSPDYDSPRWRALKAAARQYVNESSSPTLATLPPLLASQRRR
jgi:hypothetical protein